MSAAIKTQERRSWILRTAAMLAVSACLLLLLVFARRDKALLDGLMRSTQASSTALQLEVDKLGRLPAELPSVPSRIAIAYASDMVREYARIASEPVIVGSGPRTRLILAGDGCPVLLYQQGKVSAEWWPRAKLIGSWTAQEQRIKVWDQARKAVAPVLP